MGFTLYRWRSLIGVLAFFLLFCFGKPTILYCLYALPMLIIGLALRFWASGYIGKDGRAKEISGSRVIKNGPYRLLRHPLYLGNLALVGGMNLAFRPPIKISVFFILGFILMYGLIARAENNFLANSGLKPVEIEFSWRKAALEWQTWLITFIAFLFALTKALAMP
ncbi:MAG: methyltransferase family protein [bacterium]